MRPENLGQRVFVQIVQEEDLKAHLVVRANHVHFHAQLVEKPINSKISAHAPSAILALKQMILSRLPVLARLLKIQL